MAVRQESGKISKKTGQHVRLIYSESAHSPIKRYDLQRPASHNTHLIAPHAGELEASRTGIEAVFASGGGSLSGCDRGHGID